MPPASKQSLTKGRWRAIALSLLVHGLIVAAAVFGWFTWKHEPPEPETLAVQGTVVDPRELKGIDKLPETKPEPPVETPPPEPAPEVQPTPPEEQGPPAPDPEELKRKEEERLAAEKEATEKAEQEKQEQLESERQQKEEQQRLDAEKEAAAKKEAAKQAAAKAAADKVAAEKLAAEKRAAEKKKAEDAAAARKAAEEKARKASEEELRRSLEAEERVNAARNSPEANRWHASIVAKIERAWNKPPSAVAGVTCVVQVSQVPGGEVTSVQVDSCNPNEAALRQSVENAVYAASPLPTPPPGVPFERNLELTFAP